MTVKEYLRKAQRGEIDEKIGLVLPGGGMRGVYSAGALVELLSHNLTSPFSDIVGVSAGAINAAYYMSGDREAQKNIYTQDLPNGNFINLARKDKKLDIDYLIDTVLRHKYPLDFREIVELKTQLHIVLTDAQSAVRVVGVDHHGLDQLYEELRATAALPILYDKNVPLGDREYVDGAVSDCLPVDYAIELDCSRVFTILNRPLNDYKFDRRTRRIIDNVVRQFARSRSKRLRDKLIYDEQTLKKNIGYLKNGFPGINMHILEPSDLVSVSLATVNKKELEKLFMLGRSDMERFLEMDLDQA